MRTPIYERMNFTISFTSEGKASQFWLVHERIRQDYYVRLREGYVNPEYKMAIEQMDSLVKLQSVVAAHGTIEDWLDVMVECAYLLQRMCKDYVRPARDNSRVEVVVDTSSILQREMVQL
jgi:hypothetical protein